MYKSPTSLDKFNSFVKRGGVNLRMGCAVLPSKAAALVGFVTVNPELMWNSAAAGAVGALTMGAAYLISEKTKDILNGFGSKKWDKLKTDLATEFLTAEFKTPNRSVLSFALKAHELMIINDEELKELSGSVPGIFNVSLFRETLIQSVGKNDISSAMSLRRDYNSMSASAADGLTKADDVHDENVKPQMEM